MTRYDRARAAGQGVVEVWAFSSAAAEKWNSTLPNAAQNAFDRTIRSPMPIAGAGYMLADEKTSWTEICLTY